MNMLCNATSKLHFDFIVSANMCKARFSKEYPKIILFCGFNYSYVCFIGRLLFTYENL